MLVSWCLTKALTEVSKPVVCQSSVMLSSRMLLCPRLPVVVRGVRRNRRDALGQLSLTEVAALVTLLGQVPAVAAVP